MRTIFTFLLLLLSAVMAKAAVPAKVVIVKDKADQELTTLLLADHPVLTFKEIDETRHVVVAARDYEASWPAADVYVTIADATSTGIDDIGDVSSRGVSFEMLGGRCLQLTSRGLDTPVNVYDVSGNLVFSYELVADESVTIDLSNRQPGVYLVNTKAGTSKFLIK